jgi:hypothetical protein
MVQIPIRLRVFLNYAGIEKFQTDCFSVCKIFRKFADILIE